MVVCSIFGVACQDRYHQQLLLHQLELKNKKKSSIGGKQKNLNCFGLDKTPKTKAVE